MLVARWSFAVEDIDGRRVADATGGGLTMTLDEGVRIVPGRDGDGEALAFGGTRGRAIVEAAPRLALSQLFGFTVAFHVRVTDGPTGEWRALLFKQVADADARALGVWLHPDADRLRVQLFTTKGPEYMDGHARLTRDEWAHLALVVHAQGMALYVDGRPDVAIPLEHPVVTPGGPLSLGAEPGKPGMSGLMANVRIYAEALDERTIRALATE
ncbi:LamG domain-containing protein [Actinomadura harenae]|uniref:LamG domain-containing protein n=1 Tax=Actinomadura harenae TaxID=2483351 RepID=A0A3M2MEG9_9ACTN|nr:LamG domain-containing protein [Actinomadura harenae]